MQRKWHQDDDPSANEIDNGLRIDIEIYEVDGVSYAAEKTLN